MNKVSDKFDKAIDAEVLIHGEEHPAVARAHTNYGEWLLNEGDIGAARYHLEYAYRILTAVSAGVMNEDLIDSHYRVGKAIAAESRVTGSNAASKAHFLKTLAMREDYDAKIALERLTQFNPEPSLPTLSSGIDSTLIYADVAENERSAGNYKDAGILYLKSLKLRRAKFGEVSAPVAQVLMKYGDILRLSLKYTEAKTVIEEALSIYMQLFGPKHVQVTEAMNSLGQMQRLMGNLEDAEALLLESLKLRREMHGDYHVSTASSLNNLAEVCREKEDYFQSINYHNAAIEAFTKAVGAEHPGTMNAKGNLGVTLRRQARQSSDLGQALVREAMDYLKTQQYDAEHPWMAKFDTENAMAQAEHLAAEGKHEESLQLYEALISKKHIVAQLNSTTSGSPDKDQSPSKRAAQDVVLLTEGKVHGLLKRAALFSAKGQYVAAEEVYSNVIKASRRVLGIENILIYRGIISHALVLSRLAQYEISIEMLQEALQSRIDLKGPDDLEVAEASFALADVYRLCSNFDGAMALYVHCMEVVGEALRKDPFSMEKISKAYPLNELYVRVALGLAKVQTTKFVLTKARALLSQGKETASKTLGEDHPVYVDLLHQEAVIHFECGNFDEAVRVHRQCLAYRLQNSSSKVYSSLYQLARISLALCNFPQAATYLDESLALFENTFAHTSSSSPTTAATPTNSAAQHPIMLKLLSTKSLLLLEMGHYDEAQMLMESTLVSRRISLGGRHHKVADSLVALAQLGHARGLPSIVLEGLELALDIYQELFVYDMHKDISACRYQLAINAMMSGRYPQAIEGLRAVKQQREDFFNKMGVQNHIGIAQAGAALCRGLALASEELEQAEELGLAAGAMYCEALGPQEATSFGQLLISEALESLAQLCTARGKYKDSRALLSFCLALRSNVLPTSHPSVYNILILAIDNISKPGYFTAANELSQSVCDHLLSAFSDKSIQSVTCCLLQARAIMNAAMQSDPKDRVEARQSAAVSAEAFYTQALFTIRDTIGEKNSMYASIMAELGSCLQIQSKAKFPTADGMYKQAMAILQEVHSSATHVKCMDVMLRQCLLFIDMRQEEDALPLLNNQIIPLYTSALGPEHPQTMYARGLLGVCMNDKKKGTGLENIRTALLMFEDYEQLYLAADHPYVVALGGYESSAKTRTSTTIDEACLGGWCVPQEVLEEPSEDQKRLLAVLGEEAKQTKKYAFPSTETIPASEWVVCTESDGWGSVGSRRRASTKGQKGASPPTLSTLFASFLATTPPYVLGSGNSCITAAAILQGSMPPSQEAIYGDTLVVSVSDKARDAGASAQRVIGARGQLKQMAAAAAQAGVEKEEEEDAEGVRSKLSELKKTLEEEETHLAELRLQKLAEEAEAEEIRAAREAEEEEMKELVKKRKTEELAILSLQARKETEAAEAAAMTAAREKHEADLARVTDELMAKMEEVAQAEVDLKKLQAQHVAVHSMPMREEGDKDDASLVGESQSITSEIPNAVAVIIPPSAAQDSASGASTNKESTGESSASNIAATSVSASGSSVSAAKPMTEKEQKRLMALDAAAFMSTRAKELTGEGWYLKAKPLLEECLLIREKNIKLQPLHLETMVALAQNRIYCQDFHGASPLMSAALEQRIQDHSISAESGQGGCAHTIEMAEITQLQAWNLYSIGKYILAGAKFNEATKMFIEVVGDAHEKTARCMVQQSTALLQLGRYDEAKAIAERSFAILNKIYSTKDPATTLAMMARVRVFFAVGKLKEAKPLLEQCVSMRKRLLHETHPAVGECYVIMGQILMQQSKLTEAEKWLGRAMDIFVAVFDEHSLVVADVQYHQARLMAIGGQIAASTALLEKVLACRRRWLPLVLSAEEIAANTPKVKTEEELDAEADLLLKTGKKVEFKPNPPVTHSSIQDCLQSLAENCLALGKFSQADAHLKEVGKLRKEYCNEEASTDGTVCHPDLASNFFWKAELLRLQGHYATSRPVHELACEMRTKVLGKDHYQTLCSIIALAHLQVGEGQFEGAERMYRKAMKSFKDAFSDDHFMYAETQCAYSDCLRRLGRLEKSRKMLDESTAARRMLFDDDHLALVEAANNNGLLILEELRPPPVGLDGGGSMSSTEAALFSPVEIKASNAEENEEADEAEEFARLQVQSKQQSRIGGQSEVAEDESVMSSLPPPDRPVEDLLDDEAQEALLLQQGAAVEEGLQVEETREVFERDDQGVPIFNNAVYIETIKSFEAALAVLANNYTVYEQHAEIQPHPWSINLRGNIGIVQKLEFEEKLRFLFNLKKEDRKLFRKKEKRLAKLAARGEQSVQDAASTYTEEPHDKAVKSDASVAEESTVAPDEKKGSEPDEEEDEEEENKNDMIIPGAAEINAAVAALQARGFQLLHPWIVKFFSYRTVIEAPPDEMGISKEILREAAKLAFRGLYMAADLKLDEALSLQIDFLGSVPAETNVEVALTIMTKAESALVQNRLDSAKKMFSQSYFMYCKIEGPECEGACRSLQGIAECFRYRGLTEDAKLLLEKVFNMRVTLFGKQSIHAATTQAQLALCLIDLGQGTEALDAANSALSIATRLARPSVTNDGLLDMVFANYVLGRVLLAKGDIALAGEHLKVSNERQVEELGLDHVWTAHTQQALAELRFMQCKLFDARKLIGQALKVRIKTFGKLKYNSYKLRPSAREFLDKSPEGDDDMSQNTVQGAAKRLELPSGLPPPTAFEAFGGKGTTLDYDLGSLLEASVESITGSVSLASSKVSIKEEVKKGFHFRGVPVSNHALLADTLEMRGDICLTLGDLREAKDMIEGAYAVRKELFGKRAVPTAKSLFQLGVLTAYLGIPNEALMLHTLAYHLRLQLLGDAHPDLGDAQLAVARMKLLLCRLDECTTYLRDAKRVYKATLGATHYKFAHVLLLEGELLLTKADYMGATGLVNKAAGIYKAVFKDVHPAVANTLLLEGRILMAQGALDIAQVKIEQAISQCGVFFGDEHIAVADAKYWMVEIFRAQGKFLEAKPMVENVLTIRRDRLGKYHHETIAALALLAYNMLDLGKYSAATPVFERAVQLLKRSLGEDSLTGTWAEFGLAEAKREEAMYESSRNLHNRVALARRRVLSSDEHPLVIHSQQAITVLTVIAGQYDEATRAFDDILAQRRMALGQMHPEVANTLHELGEVLRLRGKLTESRSIHERALKMRRAVLNIDHPVIVDSQVAIAQLFASFGKLEQAAAMFDRCLSNYRLRKGSRHPAVARTLLLLGNVHNQLANYEAARGHILDSLMLRKVCFASRGNHPDVAESIMALADNLRLTGQYTNPALVAANRAAASTAAAAAAAAKVGEKYAGGDDSTRNSEKSFKAKQQSGNKNSPGANPKGQFSGGELDDTSVVSGMSGYGNEVFGSPMNRSVVSFDPIHPHIDPKSIDVESVHMSHVEDKFNYVSVDEFLDDGDHSMQELGGVKKGPKDAVKTKGKDTDQEPERGQPADLDEEEERYCLPLYERALDMLLKQFGLDHPRVFAVQHNVAATLLLTGSFMLGHDLFLHVLEDRRRRLGDEHLDTVDSCLGLGEALRLMSKLYPENTAQAAEKRKNPKVEKSLGPSLIEHLSSILGRPDGLKKQWPPEASTALVLLERGKTTTDTMHPLLSPPKQRLKSRDNYLGGFQGYAYPTPKKLKRIERDSALTRPPKSSYNDPKWIYDLAHGGLKRSLGEVVEHPLLASLINGKAELNRARRRPDLAIPLFEESLSVRRKLFRANHPAIADCLQGLAEIYRVENKFSRCLPLLEKVMEIRHECFECVQGSHPSIAEVQCCLGMLHYSLGQYVEAEPMYHASLELREATLGQDHIATAQTLNNYAGLLHTVGRFEDALPMHRRVLAIKIATFGEDHPDVASSKNNLALLLKAMGVVGYDEARGLYTEALASQQRVFGLMHADVASTLNNLAALEIALGNTDTAKGHYRQSLEIKRKVLGMEHPAVAATLNNLAGCCMSCGELDDAKDYYEESLRLRRLAYGDDHPSVAESLNNIALLLFSQGEYSSSLPLFERSIVIKTAAYGESHITTAASLHNLAIVLHKLRRYAEAELMYTKALEIRTGSLGAEHFETVSTRANLQNLAMEKLKAPIAQVERQSKALDALGVNKVKQ